MRQLIFPLLLTATILAACSDESAGPVRKFISFKLDNRVYLSEQPIASLRPANRTDTDPSNDFPSLTITGYSYEGHLVMFTLATADSVFRPGPYLSSQQGNSMTMIFGEGFQSFGADSYFGSLAIQLTNVQDSTIEGSFSGVLEDLYGADTSQVVRDGYFRAIVRVR